MKNKKVEGLTEGKFTVHGSLLRVQEMQLVVKEVRGMVASPPLCQCEARKSPIRK
jgi:hypothetical protein